MTTPAASVENSHTLTFGFTRYQWIVLIAAWLGWGFDVFDALLFNYVSRLCIPDLLGPGSNDPNIITWWTGLITSVLLLGWGIGGLVFGRLTDRLGRTKTLLLTMMTYAVATAACAFAPNIETLLVLRFIASLGIGGEWAAGAALVAETVPEEKRVTAGTLLYTAAPAGLFLATFVTDLLTVRIDHLAARPDLAWRIAFLTGLLPAAVAMGIRLKVREPEVWRSAVGGGSIRDLFSAQYRKRTFAGVALATIALVTWWSCNAFIPVVASFLVHDLSPVPAASQIAQVKAHLVTLGTVYFNLGGLVGTLLTGPIAIRFGRGRMFLIYFALSALFLLLVFRLPLPPETRLRLMFFNGLAAFGIFGAFTFYLPELFPASLRGTGSGFCYNLGRFLTAAGPFLMGAIASRSSSSTEILHTLSSVAVAPLLGVLLVLLKLVPEPPIGGFSAMEAPPNLKSTQLT